MSAPTVYFAETSTHIKIGWTTNLPLRLAALKCAANSTVLAVPPDLVSHDIKLIGNLDGERCEELVTHRVFSRYRVYGEWYSLESKRSITRLLRHTGDRPYQGIIRRLRNDPRFAASVIGFSVK